MPMWLARIIVVLLHLAGATFMIGVGLFLKWQLPIWFKAYGPLNVFITMGVGALVLAGVTNLIEIAWERRQRDRRYLD